MILVFLLILGFLGCAILTELERAEAPLPAGGGSCTGCGAVVEAEWLACPACHDLLRETCPGCGRQHSKSHIFCPGCGRPREVQQ